MNPESRSDMVSMPEAAKMLQVADHRVARRILIKKKIPLVRERYRELFAPSEAVAALVKERGGRVRPGRPKEIKENIPTKAKTA